MLVSPSITLTRAIYDEIIAHAREGTPEEVCGILSGRGARATGLVRARNVAENRIMDYEVDPLTLLKQFDFEDSGEEMLAIYHSHPVSKAYPSATDALNAHYPDATYLICSLQNPDQPVLQAFRLLSTKLDQRPSGVQPQRNNPRFLARQHRDGVDDYYLLAVIDESGHERWRKVQVAEQSVLITS